MAHADPATEPERRDPKLSGLGTITGVSSREEDVEPTTGLHRVAILFRVLSGMLFVLMVLQVANGVTSTVDISYGVLFAEAVRLLIFAGVLWGTGDLVDLFVKSHHDIRSTRILLGRLTHLMRRGPADHDSRVNPAGGGRGRGDGVH
jgi:hypothetical protein